MTPPPPRTNACRFANSTAFSDACAFSPTVEFEDDRLVLLERRQIEERARRQRDAGGSLPARATRRCSGPRCRRRSRSRRRASGTSHSKSTIDWWRKPPARPLTRILYVAAGIVHGTASGCRTCRIAWSPGSAGPTVTPVPAVSTVPPLQLGDQRLRRRSSARPARPPSAGRDDLLEHGRVELLQRGRLRRRRWPCSPSPPARAARSGSPRRRMMNGRGFETATPVACALRQRRAQDHVDERRRRPGGMVLRQRRAQDHVRRRRGAAPATMCCATVDDLLVGARVEHDRLADDRAVDSSARSCRSVVPSCSSRCRTSVAPAAAAAVSVVFSVGGGLSTLAIVTVSWLSPESTTSVWPARNRNGVASRSAGRADRRRAVERRPQRVVRVLVDHGRRGRRTRS